MSLQSFLLAQENYLHAAYWALKEEAQVYLHQRGERLREKIEQRISEWFQWMDALEESDMQNHQRACEEPDWDYRSADAENERQWRIALTLGREWLALCEQFAQVGFPVAAFSTLQSRVKEIHEILNWDDSYADTSTYREITEEAVREYLAGRCEIEGWES